MNPSAVWRLAGLCAALATCFSLAPTQAAVADTGPGGACSPSLSQPFLPRLDPSRSLLAPGGNFESGPAGWSLSGASIVAGNEPWYVSNAGDSHSLRLPAGAAAVAPSVCVGLNDPTTRFFARNTSPLGLGQLLVTADISAG